MNASSIPDMEHFTPPPPPLPPPPPSSLQDPLRSHAIPRSLSSAKPPPIPPPPRDYPLDRRASTESRSRRPQTDNMPGRIYSRRTSGEQSSSPPGSPQSGARPRRGSFGFLSRSKSRTREVPTVTAPSGHTMLRKQKVRDQEEQLRQRRQERESRPPPVLPSHSPLPSINTFGGDDARPDSIAIISNTAHKTSNFSRPYQPTASSNMPASTSLPILNKRDREMGSTSPDPRNADARYGEYVPKSQTRADSMTSRPYSTTSGSVGNVNSPRRVRRRKDPTPFNVLVVGAKNSGKSCFIDFLKNSLTLPEKKGGHHHSTPHLSTSTGTFSSSYLESELEGERVGLTLWDSQGLEKTIVDLQLKEITTFIESKFEETFAEEQKVQRTPGSKDSHIHCIFLIMDPARVDATARNSNSHKNGNAFASSQRLAGLDREIDLQVMKALAGKTTVIPVVSKADTLTSAHMAHLKRAVWNSVQAEKLDPLEALDLEEESEDEFEPDSDEPVNSDSDDFPIQSTTTTSSVMVDAREHQDEEDDATNGDPYNPSQPRNKSATSTGVPYSGQASRRPQSRLASRSATPGDSQAEDIYIPFSVLSPDPYDPETVGRQFAWGLADPFNPDHCDFVRLRDSVFSEWRNELRSAAREKWYENWRTSRLKKTPQKIRQAGGVTPVGVVPREGRTISGERRNISPFDAPQSAGHAGLGCYGSPGGLARPATSGAVAGTRTMPSAY